MVPWLARLCLLLPVTAAVVALAGGCSGSPAPTSPARAAAQRAENDLQNDYQTVIDNVLPSVVQIETGRGLGSGIVYDDEGHIVTNAHVVGVAREFRVTVATGEQPLTAKLVASYPEQDLAVVKLDRVPADLKPAVLGDSSKVELGQIVLAMGSPLGLSGSVTQGIVSAVGRTVSESRGGGGPTVTIANMVQTSAPINPGNSGGALVNLDSEVIGIPTLAARDPGLDDSAAPGIGFAIPASTVKKIADQLIRDGRVTDSGRAALGITARTVLNENYEPLGVAVVEVTEGGPADKAGLRRGDIITKVDDAEIRTITSLAEELASRRPGETVRVMYLRDGEPGAVNVTLGEA
ncbi:trypsin-like peptidase domain-containing protein [Streptomyces sp. MNU76]|uniref:S1C family serine protease n=1 Tax=Streptomyces sp. MNU76 TaxID=2560026 RepID=UPI001E604701|nr:trypsin-like peptidase domain-containing protein [Streptomyces sp. MNU76]MCC9708446.1 trypsin-like peptidase domain-containing protein [Streptomyces sp. MNU76]